MSGPEGGRIGNTMRGRSPERVFRKATTFSFPVRDNRRALRIKISLPVSYQLLDGKSVLPDVYEGHVVDISYGGMMINTPILMNQFSDVKMKVNLSPLMTEPLDIYAKALYVQQKGEATEVGLAFRIIDDTTSAAVKSLVDNMV